MESLKKNEIKHFISENYKKRIEGFDFLMWYEFDLMLKKYLKEARRLFPDCIPQELSDDEPYFQLAFETQDSKFTQIKDSYYCRVHVLILTNNGYIAIRGIDFYINPLLLMPQGFENDDDWIELGLNVISDAAQLLPEISIKLTNDIIKSPHRFICIKRYVTYKYKIPKFNLESFINEKYCDVGTYRPRAFHFNQLLNPKIIKEVGGIFEDFHDLHIGGDAWHFETDVFGLVGTHFYDPTLILSNQTFLCFLFAQKNNKYDANAIQVYMWSPTESSHFPYEEFKMIGYIPKKSNNALHKKMCDTNNRLLFAYQENSNIHILGALSEFSHIITEYSKKIPLLKGKTLPYEFFKLLR